MRIFFVVLLIGLLTGCATVPPPAPAPTASRVKPERTALNFDNPADVFTPVFKEPRWFVKQEPETEAQYRQRLAQIGIEGRLVTFLIPAELCEVYNFGEQGVYAVVSHDRLTLDRHEASEKKWAITLAAGTGPKLMVRLEGFDRFPVALRWKDRGDAGYTHFGLPIRSADPVITTLLKERKAGLAIRGKIGNLATCVANAEVQVLPFLLEDAFVYDPDSQTSIMRWSSKP